MKENRMISLMMTLCTIINNTMFKISNNKVKSDNFKILSKNNKRFNCFGMEPLLYIKRTHTGIPQLIERSIHNCTSCYTYDNGNDQYLYLYSEDGEDGEDQSTDYNIHDVMYCQLSFRSDPEIGAYYLLNTHTKSNMYKLSETSKNTFDDFSILESTYIINRIRDMKMNSSRRR